jgi:hypothetical protein
MSRRSRCPCPPIFFTAIIFLCTGAAALAQRPSPPYALVQQICRQYAAAADALPHGTMYAQCMCARGYRVAGFSPLLGYGYQCELRVGHDQLQ